MQGLHVSECVLGFAKAYEKAIVLLEELATTKVNDLYSVAEIQKVLAPIVAAKQ